MIPLFQADGQTRAAHSYNGLTVNDPDDPPNDTYELNSAMPTEQLDWYSEPSSNSDGLEAYDVRKIAKIWRLEGTIRAPDLASFYDKCELLAKTFDAAKVSHENPTNEGFLPYDFSLPTKDTTTYPSGAILCRYYARARASVSPLNTEYQGFAGFFTLQLLCRDPRRYLQTASTLTGAGTANNTKADYRSWPTLSIAMSGAGSATYTITRASTLAATEPLVLDLSGRSGGQTVTVDMETGYIKVGGVLVDLFVSGTFWQVEPGNNTISITNATNATTTTTWRSAFCL
jgi:hypothetical protein